MAIDSGSVQRDPARRLPTEARRASEPCGGALLRPTSRARAAYKAHHALVVSVVNFSRPLHGNDGRTGDKVSVVQTLLASAQVEGHRRIRGRCSQKNGW